MKIWRMKLRAGPSGEDMWPQCKERAVASMTHGPILNTDLTKLKKSDVDRGVMTAARSSIWRFAWDICGGDVIYVGDSKTKSIIARGYVKSKPGERAYRYNAEHPIRETKKSNSPWRHEVPVEWDKDFVPFRHKDWAPHYTVTPFERDPNAIEKDGPISPQKKTVVDPEQSLLNEGAYMRETEASNRNIQRLHAALSNHFRLWIEETFGVRVDQEKRRIDLNFGCFGKTHLAELKICYGANTRHAIREALGQLFEYNHYPPYTAAGCWWLVLDHAPSNRDRKYISDLRDAYDIPLTIGWKTDRGFEVFPCLPWEFSRTMPGPPQPATTIKH